MNKWTREQLSNRLTDIHKLYIDGIIDLELRNDLFCNVLDAAGWNIYDALAALAFWSDINDSH